MAVNSFTNAPSDSPAKRGGWGVFKGLSSAFLPLQSQSNSSHRSKLQELAVAHHHTVLWHAITRKGSWLKKKSYLTPFWCVFLKSVLISTTQPWYNEEYGHIVNSQPFALPSRRGQELVKTLEQALITADLSLKRIHPPAGSKESAEHVNRGEWEVTY